MLNIANKYENEYYAYYFLSPNTDGFIGVEHDKEYNEWWLVHASSVYIQMEQVEVDKLKASVLIII